jgi:hypothetical protein
MSIAIPKLTRRQLDNFWAKISMHIGGCWLWKAGISPDGYGKFNLNGNTYRAHRVMLSLENRRSELPVLHSCNNPLCVRPDHLRFGTYKENTQDRLVDGTHQLGTRNNSAKLTREIVESIRASKDTTLQALADKYGVTKQSVWAVVHNKSWNHKGS